MALLIHNMYTHWKDPLPHISTHLLRKNLAMWTVPALCYSYMVIFHLWSDMIILDCTKNSDSFLTLSFSNIPGDNNSSCYFQAVPLIQSWIYPCKSFLQSIPVLGLHIQRWYIPYALNQFIISTFYYHISQRTGLANDNECSWLSCYWDGIWRGKERKKNPTLIWPVSRG